jgi:hypothetical protein
LRQPNGSGNGTTYFTGLNLPLSFLNRYGCQHGFDGVSLQRHAARS